MHKTVEKAAIAITNDPELCAACLAGQLSLQELAQAQVDRRKAAMGMYRVINGHHHGCSRGGELVHAAPHGVGEA